MLISDLCVACIHVTYVQLYMCLDTVTLAGCSCCRDAPWDMILQRCIMGHIVSCDCYRVKVGYLSKLVLNVVAYVLIGLVYCHIKIMTWCQCSERELVFVS